MQQRHREICSAILLGGLIAAAIDIGAACLITGRSPVFITQVIAGGLLGNATFDGGIGTVILGALLQEVMGVLIAAIYVALLKSVPALMRQWIPSGLVYGVIIFFVMNYGVVPLSVWKSPAHFTPAKFAANMAAMLVFGLIVAYFCRDLVSAPAARNQSASAS
jgi:hypothetical protein